MRHVVTHREEARAKGQAARRYLEANFSPEAVAKGLQRLVLDVQHRAAKKAQAIAEEKAQAESPGAGGG